MLPDQSRVEKRMLPMPVLLPLTAETAVIVVLWTDLSKHVPIVLRQLVALRQRRRGADTRDGNHGAARAECEVADAVLDARRQSGLGAVIAHRALLAIVANAVRNQDVSAE